MYLVSTHISASQYKTAHLWQNWVGGMQPKTVGRRSFGPNQDRTKIRYTRIHLHVAPNPTCSHWYDLERLKAAFKPDTPPPPQYKTTCFEEQS